MSSSSSSPSLASSVEALLLLPPLLPLPLTVLLCLDLMGEKRLANHSVLLVLRVRWLLLLPLASLLLSELLLLLATFGGADEGGLNWGKEKKISFHPIHSNG